uniref:Uncharacterized protein n=1 Tax=Arundo donax TaxID=35708 RepID=A0A0A9EVY7_ARUDO
MLVPYSANFLLHRRAMFPC